MNIYITYFADAGAGISSGTIERFDASDVASAALFLKLRECRIWDMDRADCIEFYNDPLGRSAIVEISDAADPLAVAQEIETAMLAPIRVTPPAENLARPLKSDVHGQITFTGETVILAPAGEQEELF